MPSINDEVMARFIAEEKTSVFASGQQAAPVANTAIATSASLDPGTWDIEVTTHIGGTTVAAVESDNMVFKLGAATLTTITNPVPGTAGSQSVRTLRCRVSIAVATAVSVVSGASAATASSVYTADIVATKVAE